MGRAHSRSNRLASCWRALPLLPLLLLPAASGGSSGGAGSNASGSDERRAAIFKYGDDPSATHPPPGPRWTYALAGDDWRGPSSSSSEPWACLSGRQQSPVALPASAVSGRGAARGAPQHAARFELGVLRPGSDSGVRVANNGHSVIVTWRAANASSGAGAGGVAPRLSIAVKEGSPLLSALSLAPGDAVQRVTALPQQFHFHTRSEHLLAGRIFPLEAHLVSVVPPEELPACAPHGCTVVTAVLFELGAEEEGQTEAGGGNSSLLDALAQALPVTEGESVPLPAGAEVDLQAGLLPGNLSYAAYAGSLTTPPCSEGVLWLVLTTPQQVTPRQWRRFMTAVSDVNCTEVPAGGLGATQQQQQQQPQLRRQQRAGTGVSGNRGAAGGSPSRRQLQVAHGLAGSSSSSSSSSNSRLLVESADGPPSGVRYRCTKLGGGSNARLPQPLNGRRIVLWVDGGASDGGTGGGSSGSGSGSRGAAGAGVAAGAALGGSLGASLVLVGCFVVYSRQKAKRQLYGSGSGDMLMVARVDDGEGVPWLGGAGSSSAVGSLPQRLSHRNLPL